MPEQQVPELHGTSTRDVFISYASQDAQVANAMVKALEKRGIKCWIAPRDVRAGAQYADAIVRAISDAKALVLVLSASAIASSHVGKEIERASSKKHPIIALRIDAAPLTPAFEYFLSESQWVEVRSGKMEPAYARLIEAISGTARPVSAIAPTVSPGTPAGEAPAAQPNPLRIRTALAAGVSVLALALAVLWADRYWRTQRVKVEQPGTSAAHIVSEKSIAVLPFLDMSEKHDQEYFSDGLSEELIDHLAHNPGLRVVARTSSFAFKGKNEDVTSIAAKLRVANLLEGSVRKAGGELRISAQLIRASDGVHLWSQTYKRDLKDIFKLQDEIATTVSSALQVALDPASRIGPTGTTNMEAYSLVLKGNYYFARGNIGDHAEAIKSYLDAIRLEPGYAQAWGRLARTYIWQSVAGNYPPAEAAAKARQAAQRALAVDPNCAIAHYALGNVHRFYDYDWNAAIDEFERVLALDPYGAESTNSQNNIAEIKMNKTGGTDATISALLGHLARNPVDTDALNDLAWAQKLAGQLDASAATYRRLLELNANFPTAQAQYAYTLVLLGKPIEALTAAQREPDEAWRLAMLACVHWTLRHRTESTEAGGKLEAGFANTSAYLIAMSHACRGEADVAIDWLERAYRQRAAQMAWVRVDLVFRQLYSQPRYQALLVKMNLAD